MHILLLTAYFPPETGSAANLYYELGKTFLDRGHTVSVVTGFPGYHVQGDVSQYQGRRWLKENVDSLSVYRIAVPQIARNTPIGRGLWQFSCALATTLPGMRVPHPDVVLVYSPPLPLGLTALAWRWLRKTPFVFNVQDLFPQSAIDLGLLRRRLLIAFFEALEHFLYRRADAITVHSPGNRDHVLAQGGRSDSTFVVPNSVDVGFIRPGPKENALRRKLGLNGKFVVSFAGVMGFSQDLDVIIEAAHLLVEHSSIHFLLVGDGVEKKRLVEKSREMQLPNVTWLPIQPRDRYPDVLHASDVGLATLHAEVKTPVVPSKIWSNMAAGLPVIAALSLDGDAPRLIQEAQGGICVPPEQPEALAESILSLYRDANLRQRLGTNGRHYVEKYLSPQAVIESYEYIFEQVLLATAENRS